ncbi:branched-chain amino acid ABC transporter permease [Oceanicella actignis]|uniref:Branched-chain amino acid transport system permease protein n=1 Tax=Oceanicella actignis TaxID=1189325 RepID=A0A1M7S2V8_9RHOB|nr:branched-chain amino acid ABC transporter permease [Oceanicella actignis]TYO90195.1 amino acid/amide ABC transporter membrane protein 2 (HAAT family) [Oceanicella actignis]SES89806.1 amino acid/amide ABC transporter membrane protein 2, HAAT family [Oceanicella actignis]SHN52831.1 branched-chain amino acid transport system permease protein [Oceanicella actignis]
MKFHFKTSYEQDIRIFEDRAKAGWYGLLALLAAAAPYLLDEYMLGELTLMLIWALAGLGLMLLAGHTGQPSLGHAAFLACGAYMEVWLAERGVPFPISFPLAGLFAGVVGALIAVPALKMSGIYLAIATLAVGIITEDVIILLEDFTGGIGGVYAPSITLLGTDIDRYADGGRPFYWLCLAALIAVNLIYLNILRSPTGRAFVAIRDSEVSARAMGVNVARYKTLAFGLSCFFTGLAGALLAHFLGAFNYEAFLVLISVQMLLMVTIGGLGSIHGAYLGAIVVVFLPQAIVRLREQVAELMGAGNASIPGLDTGVFALVLIAFILIEPTGLYGRWLKIRTFFELFPLYRKDMFKRHKSFLKTERMK